MDPSEDNQERECRKSQVAEKYLQITCGELYSLLKLQNPDVKVGKSIFFGLCLKNVLLVSSTPYSTCHCEYHGNIILS